MSSLVLTEGSPLAKGFPTFLTLTGFLPNMNISGEGEGWTKAETVSTFTVFTRFSHRDPSCWLREEQSQKALWTSSHSKGFPAVQTPLCQKEKRWLEAFPHHCTQVFSPGKTLMQSGREQRSQEAYPLTLYLKIFSLGWRRLFWTKAGSPRLSSIPGIHKASLSVNLLVPQEVWPAAEGPPALGTSPVASLEVNPHVTEACPLEKGFLTFGAVPGFPSAWPAVAKQHANTCWTFLL